MLYLYIYKTATIKIVIIANHISDCNSLLEKNFPEADAKLIFISHRLKWDSEVVINQTPSEIPKLIADNYNDSTKAFQGTIRDFLFDADKHNFNLDISSEPSNTQKPLGLRYISTK